MQSQRLPLYREHAQQLLDTGHAYHCFCGADRLEELRRSAAAHKLPYRYDRRCLGLPADVVRQQLQAGVPHTVRLKVRRRRRRRGRMAR